jgi:hypothetical protein
MMEKAVDFTALSLHLTPEEKLKLFDMLCDAHDGKRHRKRLPEKISQDLGIPRTHVYRYLSEEGRKRRIPNAETTTRIIKSLMHYSRSQATLPILEPAYARMCEAWKVYRKWIKRTKYNPFSLAEIRKLERNLP